MRRSVVALLVCLVAAAGCSSEEEPYDDGSDASVIAGVSAALPEGAEVVAPDAPTDATRDEVTAALGAAGLDDPAGLSGSLAVDTGAVAGLLAAVGAAERYVVLVFDDPFSAAVFAEDDRAVFTSEVRDERRTTWFAGSLVAYSDPRAGLDPQLRSALRSLAGRSS